jgi:hypothetical protein
VVKNAFLPDENSEKEKQPKQDHNDERRDHQQETSEIRL